MSIDRTTARSTLSSEATFALALALCVVAIGFPSLYYPFGRDQGIHAYIAKLVGDGYVIYRDVFNVKPPLTTVIHWLALVLFGENMRAIRIMDLLIVAATALMLQSLVARTLRSLWLGTVAGIAYAVMHYSVGYRFTAQTDGWCNLFLVAAMLLYSRSLDTPSVRARLVRLCGVGVMVGLSFWLKYTTAAILIVFPSVHLACRMSWRRILRDGAAVAGGFLACVGLGFAALAAMGALPAFLDIQEFMRSYAEYKAAWWIFLISPLLVLVYANGPIVLGVIGLYPTCKGLRDAARRPEAIALLTWLAAAWASAEIQGKFFLYHLLPQYPPLAIAAAVALYALIGRLRRVSGRALDGPVAATACLAIVLISPIPATYRDVAPVVTGGKAALRAYWDSDRFGHTDFWTRDDLALVDYLKQKTLPCDRVYLWGYEPEVYFLSHRRPVSRFIYDFPMFVSYYRQAYRDEFMADIAAQPPAVFIVEHEDRTPHVSGHHHDSAEVLQQFTALKSFVTAQYHLRDRVSRFDVYFRRDIDPAAARRCPAPAAREGRPRRPAG